MQTIFRGLAVGLDSQCRGGCNQEDSVRFFVKVKTIAAKKLTSINKNILFLVCVYECKVTIKKCKILAKFLIVPSASSAEDRASQVSLIVEKI